MSTRIPLLLTLLKWVGFAVLVLAGSAQAQPPDTLWTRRYGTESYDRARSVAQTPDGGFIIAGETWDSDTIGTCSSDAYVVKIDSLGNEQWSRRWGGGEQSDYISKVIVLEDGFIAAGAWAMIPPSKSIPSKGWLLRLNQDGDTLWTRKVAGPNGFARFEGMIATENETFVAVGRSFASLSPDLWMVKFDSMGDTLWTRSFGGPYWEQGWSVTLAADGGYVACGYTSSFGGGLLDFWLIKVSPDGDSLWSRTFGFGASEEARAIALAPDGGFFLGGYSASLSQTGIDAWIVRTDSLGNYLWDKDLAGEFQLGIKALVATDHGGVIAAGLDDPAGHNGQALYMARVSSEGDSVWARSWFQEWWSVGYDLISLPNGGYIAVGTAGMHSGPECATGDMWFIRLSPDGTRESPMGPYLPTELALSVYPNPFNSVATVSFTLLRPGATELVVYDVLGRTVRSIPMNVLSPGEYRTPLDATGLASGSYWVRLTTPADQAMQRIVLQK